MTDIELRNHPSFVIRKVFVIAVVMYLITYLLPNPTGTIIFLSGIIVGAIVSLLIWSTRKISFISECVIVRHCLIFKKKRTIPYSKIASVNSVRNFADKILRTTTISININSSVKTNIPKAHFILGRDLAEDLEKKLVSRLSRKESPPDESDTDVKVISFTRWDSLVQCIFGIPTRRFIYGVVLTIYIIFVVKFMRGEGAEVLFALLMLSVILPSVFSYFKYNNFKAYRTGDTIHIQHGTIRKYRSSFDVSRINAIRVKSTFLARIIGRSILEAEVIGIDRTDGNVRPALSLLAKKNRIRDVQMALIPEFMEDIELSKQPDKAKFPLISIASTLSIIAMLAMIYPYLWTKDMAWIMYPYETIFSLIPLIMTALIVLCLFYSAHVSFKICKFGMGENMFSFVNGGILNRETTVIPYDRVQIFSLGAGNTARRFGLAKANVHVLSPLMKKEKIISGYFEALELRKIGEKMMERISDGTYDCHREDV